MRSVSHGLRLVWEQCRQQAMTKHLQQTSLKLQRYPSGSVSKLNAQPSGSVDCDYGQAASRLLNKPQKVLKPAGSLFNVAVNAPIGICFQHLQTGAEIVF